MSTRILEEDSDSSMQHSIASFPSQSTASERPGSRPGSMRAMLLVKACGRSVVVPEGNGVTLMLLHVQKALQKELEAEDQVFKITDSAGGRIRTDQELREAVLNGRTPLKAKPATAHDTMIKREELAQIICQVVQEQLQSQVSRKISQLTQQVGFLTEELDSFKKERANLKEREELAQIETKREELAQIICQVVQEQQVEVFSELGRLSSENERLHKELQNVTNSVDLISRETSAVQRAQRLHKDLIGQLDGASAYDMYKDVNDKASPHDPPTNEASNTLAPARLPLAEMLLAPSPSNEEVGDRHVQGTTPNQQQRIVSVAPGLAHPGESSVLQPMRSTVSFADPSFKKQNSECSKSASPAQDWRQSRTTLPASEEVRRRPLSSDGIRSEELEHPPSAGVSDPVAWRKSLPSASTSQSVTSLASTNSRWLQGVPLQPGLVAPVQPGPLQPGPLQHGVQLGSAAQPPTASTLQSGSLSTSLQTGPPPGLSSLKQGKVVSFPPREA